MSKIIIDDQEYKIDEMSETARALTAHIQDLQKKINQLKMDLDQALTAKNVFTANLKFELEKELEKAEKSN